MFYVTLLLTNRVTMRPQVIQKKSDQAFSVQWIPGRRKYYQTDDHEGGRFEEARWDMMKQGGDSSCAMEILAHACMCT